ncbi:hypothetical protein TTHERM_00316610 (macronuclear) [Tetrahymena thermophila SB210]|uniref:Uncharacterized protein n=1 Tax=Tetrahymena thermophila (strain SB210) TaxID=312017 RepID=I7M2Q6_TETTS|nr:hypothetical protein TTHERM_00316610 [Tetrahymena thermophila SB210]EAS01108.1 hypothetical protein TTHERM_00316610 [Tetrahymena thermophila SB210]|eukprot:XP_001021353.1 hypothetical protein TTHERM_00316610 [Tetrahymena thermophila SB210]
MRSQNSCLINGINNNVNNKSQSKFSTFIDKKAVGTAKTRQRPTQLGGITQVGVNQSTSLQHLHLVASPDSSQFHHQQQQQQLQQANHNINLQSSPQSTAHLSFLIKPGFQLNNINYSQNNRMANNSCSNIPTQSLINSMMNENQSQLFETSQIHNHNKQQSYGSSTNLRNHSHYQGQQQQLNIFQQFKNNFFKQPTFSHPSSTTNQDKRFSEQLNSKSTVKLMQLVQNQHETDTCPQNIFQNISQKAQMKNQSSSRNNQKLRKTNSMSMIRLRQSQDSFLDQIINGESHINQARVNCQAKKKKKTKKYGMATGGYVVSPTSLPSNSTPKTIAPNSAAATLSKMIQSSTNRIKSIPSPSTVHTHLQNKTLDSFKQYQILTNPTSSQSEQSPELFQKLKKKKMLLYQQNSKTNSNLLIVNEQIQKKQQKQQNMQQQKQIQNDDLNNKNNQNLQVIDQHQMLQQENYIQPFENTPSYQMWLLQQQQEQQYTQQPHFVDNTTIPISSQTLKNTASTLSQQSLTSGWQFSCQQLPFQIVNSCNLDGCTTNSNLKQSSKTNSLFDKLNQINKQSNKNLISSKNSTQNLPSQENFETQSNNLNFQVYSDQHQNKIQSIRNQESLKNNEGETFQNTHLVSRLKDLIGCQSNNSTQSPKTSSDSKKVEDCLTDNIVENDNNKSLNLTNQLMQSAQQIHIPLPSQALKSNQYDQYVSILEEFKNLQHDQNLQEFVDYLIVFARKYVKPIPQIVKNAQQISSQCKKKDEEVNKLKQEKLSILNEKNKQQQQKQFVQNDKMVPQYIQISQQNQQTLKELHTPSTQIEETSQQSLVIDQQTQIQMLKKQIEDKDNQLSNLIQRENVTIAYFKQLQKLGYLTISSSLASDSSERNRNGNTTSNIEDKKTGIDLSNHNTPHSINPLEYSGNKSPNPFNAYNQHNQQSEEKDYQFSSNFISIPSNDNESNKIQQQYLQSHFQKMAQNHSQNHENFLSEQPSSIRQSSGKSYQNQQEINQQFNQWLKFINNKKKVQTKQQSQFNVLNKVSPQNQIDTKKQNNGCNKYQQNTQTNYLNPDFSMNLDHSQPTQTNSVSDRNSNEMHQNKILNMKTNQVKTEAIDERKNKDQHISRAIEQVLQRNQSNQIIPKLENTKQDKIEIQKDLDNSMQRYTAAAVDKYIDPQGEGIQQESQNPQFKFQLNNQMSLEDYKKKTSKLSSVSNSARNSFTSKSSFIDDDDDDQNKLEIQNKIFSAQLELQQRYNQTMIIKSKSSSNLNENIRQKLKLDLSILKSPQSSKNQLTQGKIIGFQQNNNLESLQQQQAKQQEVPEQNQVMDYYDEFMSKIDEFSLSWRKAVIDESQKYQNRDNPFKKQQLIDQQKQLQ